MTVEVLKNRTEILKARAEMRRMGIDCATPRIVSALRRIGLMPGIVLGDREKSWDVLKTVRYIERAVPKDASVLDIGSYASEVPCALLHAGYTDLTGIDLNPAVRSMPHADRIRYVVGNFLETPFDDGTFRAVTAISVIEHGFDGGKLLAELARLIQPGGYFLASIDYWWTPPASVRSGWTGGSSPKRTCAISFSKRSDSAFHRPGSWTSPQGTERFPGWGNGTPSPGSPSGRMHESGGPGRSAIAKHLFVPPDEPGGHRREPVP
jgi:SAM-dependent methyltransferase